MLGKRGHGLQLGPGFFFGGLLALISGAVPFAPVLLLAVLCGEGNPKVFAASAVVCTLAWWVFIVHRGYGWHLLAMLVVFGISVAIVRCIN